MIKKISSLKALTAFLVSIWIVSIGATILTSLAAFPDVPNDHPNKTAIEFLQTRGVISGAEDGNFYPDRPVNRAEFLKMASISSPTDLEPGAGLSFPDVSATDWFYDFVRKAFHAGVVKGYDDGFFKPAQIVLKVEALKMLIKSHGISTQKPGVAPYSDVPADAWFSEFVAYAKEKKLIELSGNLFSPAQEMTRGELAEIIYRLIVIRERDLDMFISETMEEQMGREISVTDGVKHSVPLSDILAGGPPKDGIPSIDNPKFISVAEADEFLNDEGIGVAYSANGIDRFYPHQITVWHEIVNDNVGGQPALITYCPLCGTGIVFEPILEGEVVEFGTSGKLWNSNLVMYDRKTQSYWSQVLGEAIVGELTGMKLTLLPYDNLRWKDWKKQFPNGEVLSRDTGYFRDYTQSPYVGYESSLSVFFPVDHTDDSFHPKEPTWGIVIGDEEKVYPQSELEKGPANFTDALSGVPLNVSFDKENLTIDIRRADNGEEVVPFYGFWFSWISVHPESEVYRAN